MNEQVRLIKADSGKDLLEKLLEVQNDKNARVVILSFSDEKSFQCFDETLPDLIEQFHIPIITIIKSEAKGFLFEIILATHICIISDFSEFEDSKKSLLEKDIGSKRIGKLNSFENLFGAKSALSLGIVNKIVQKDKLEKEALKMAKDISKLAPIAMQFCLKAVNKGIEMSLVDGLKLEIELFGQIFATADMKEGTSAFLEKRTPKFSGE